MSHGKSIIWIKGRPADEVSQQGGFSICGVLEGYMFSDERDFIQDMIRRINTKTQKCPPYR